MDHLNLVICSEWVDVQTLEKLRYPLCPCEFPAGPGDIGATTDTLYRGGNCGSDGPTPCLRSQSLAPGPPLRLLEPNSGGLYEADERGGRRLQVEESRRPDAEVGVDQGLAVSQGWRVCE